MPERRKRQRGTDRGATRRREGGGRPGRAKAASAGGTRARAGGPTWALDVHLTAPGRGKGDAAHRIEAREPFEVLGIVWPTKDGDPVKVDVVIEELRAQFLIPEGALPGLQESFGSAHRRRRSEEPAATAESAAALKPERVQGRAGGDRKPRPARRGTRGGPERRGSER